MQLTALSLALTRIGLGGFGVGSSLNLDFTSGNQTLDPRITFSRASNATVTGPDGTLQYAPHNLLTFSEQFDNAVWGVQAATITANSTEAPNGTSTADTFTETSSNGDPRLPVNVTLVTGSAYSLSVYAKVKPGSSQRYLMLVFNAGFSSVSGVNFDLVTGSVGAALNASGNIESVGNGWYRCSITPNTTATTTSGSLRIRLSNVDTAANIGSPSAYTGDGVSGIFLWGAQLNVGSLQPYYPTTVKNLLGFTQEFDNAAWTKSNSFVQTNLLTYSEQFDNPAWGRTGITVTANAAVAPDGTTTADLLAATLADCTIGRYSVATSAGTLHTASVWMRADTPTTLSIFLIDSGGGSGNTNAVCNVTTAWQRFTVQRTTSAGTTTIGFQVGGGNTFSSGESVYIWGAQLVQGSTAGDYQRTEGTVRAVMYPAPDGSRTADKLVEDAATNAHYVQVGASVTSGTTYTFSFYAKEGERNFAVLLLAAAGFGSNTLDYFNLSTGAVAQNQSGTATMTPVGGGWYRCSATRTATATSVSAYQIRTAVVTSSTNYTGDGTSGIYIWGAQLSDSASLDPYVYNPGAAPASAAYYGPRFDYDPVTLAPRGLLIEEQRTNLLLQSNFAGAVAGTPGTAPTGWVLANSGGSINSVVADDLGQNIVGLSASANRQTLQQILTLAANTSYFCSSVVVSNSGLAINQLISVFNTPAAATLSFLINGSTVANPNIAIPVAGDKIGVLLVVSTTAGTGLLRIGVGVSGNVTGSHVFKHPQVEAGAFPTSYIPTTTAAATRAADVAVMTGANFSNWYRQDEGTLFSEAATPPNLTTFPYVWSVSDGSTSNQLGHYAHTSGYYTNVRSDGVVQGDPGRVVTPVVGELYKFATAVAQNNAVSAANGLIGTVDSTLLMPVGVNQMRIGATSAGSVQLNGHIRKIAYFPRRLSNAELQGITS